MRAGVIGAPEEDLADIDAVSQDAEDDLEVEGLALSGAVAVAREPLPERRCSDSAAGVALKDQADDGCLIRVDLQKAPILVVLVAERDLARRPLPAGGLSLHASDDPLDNGRALELGKDAEHLHHHPASGC
ncbi:MAG TPA: hypothetical protein VIJ39_04530 [Solirubrobacteraceae bacterium]